MLDSDDQRERSHLPEESALYGPAETHSQPGPESGLFHRPGEPPHAESSWHGSRPIQPAEPASYSEGEGPLPPRERPKEKKSLSRLLLAPLIGALLCLSLGGLVGWQIGHSSALENAGLTGNTYKSGGVPRTQIIAQGRQAVVQINVQTAQGQALGSGVIMNQKGDIVTNNHVVAGGQKYQVVLFDGTSLPAQLVGTDAPDDLAIVKITPPKRLYVMPLGDSANLQVGDDVLAIGNPLGITQTVTSGIVSALGRTVPEGENTNAVIIDAVQTDAAINPGNSGGALVNMQGQLIGVPTLVAIDPEFKTPANGVGFAIPANRVKFIAPQLIRDGKVTHSGRPAIGATVITVDSQVQQQGGLSVDKGALVVSVQANGAAAQAGLKIGDVIVQVDKNPVDSSSDLTDALVNYNPGDIVKLGIVRGKQQMQARVKLGELKIS